MSEKPKPTRSREEMREYQRARRARMKAEGREEAVVTPIARDSAVDSVVGAVRDEVERLPMALKRPADVATALAMAKILDDSDSIPQQASAARQLRELMAGLRSEVESGKSKLQSLREGRASG